MKRIALLVVFFLSLAGCTAYKSQYVSFRPPEGYGNHTETSGVSMGAEAFAEKRAAREAFGFDIRGAGLLPVMLVLDNKSGQPVEIVSAQSFLVDDGGRYWPMVSTYAAIDRLEKSTQLASFFGAGAGKGALLGAAAGTVIGTALGIVSGNNVAEYLAKGAAVGAAGGAVAGGTKEGTSSERGYRITEDLREKGLEGKTVPDQYLASGFLFFPGEATGARELRLQWRERTSGVLHRATLPLAAQR